MDQVYVIDTETTGMAKPIVPVELALLRVVSGPCEEHRYDEAYYGMFNPGKDIEIGAMATHHITPWDVQNAPKWSEYQLPNPIDYLVGHNVDYDWEAVGSDPRPRRICTLALSRRLWPDIDSHKLAAVLYHIEGPAAKLSVAGSHSARTDATNTLRLLKYITRLAQPTSWEHLWAISEDARIPERMSFGKHGPQDGKKGMPIKEMIQKDPGYVKWLLKLPDLDPYLRIALNARA
jgi:exodeoxyribonuclease X